MSDELPTSRLIRAARLARLGARSAAGIALRRDPAALAIQAAEVLADMRGLAAKAGQLGSYLDGVVGVDVPPGVREALQRLNDATRTSDFARVEAVIREDLPARADELLAAMERAPAASGSIAQVHRAVFPDGRAVAVKVQHPGIARVLTDELGQARLITKLVGGVVPGTRAVFDEVTGRLREELDQRKEAANLRAFAAAIAGVPDVVLPEVIDAWTGDRVLTTTWCDGVDLDAAAGHPDEALRARHATALLASFARSVGRGCVHADPNAGNFRFREDGAIVVLDFGCVQPLPDAAREAFSSALANADAVEMAALLAPNAGRAQAAAVELSTALLAPFAATGRIDKSDLHRIARAIQAFKAGMARHRTGAGPAWAPLPLRTWLGLLAHVSRLDAPVDGPAVRAWAVSSKSCPRESSHRHGHEPST